MGRRRFASAYAVALSLITSLASSARADEPFPTLVAVELNPLAPIAGRISSTFEVMPDRHHAIVLTPYVHRHNADGLLLTDPNVSFSHAWAVAYAIEAGYRFYSGRRGPHGFYVGPSVVFGSQWNAPGEEGDPHGRSTVFGLVVDVGGQVRAGDFIIGGGAGAGLSSERACASPCTGGLVGRVLFSIGWVLTG
jgi:hypothetical protein